MENEIAMTRNEAETTRAVLRVLLPEEATIETAGHLSRLSTQLRGGEPITVTQEWLAALLAFPMMWLVVAETRELGLAGMLTLSAFPRVSGWTPWIESVVVDEGMRGQGIGRALVEKAVDIACAAGFASVNLSSRP
jgi:GNAT superfamily N-acetyltransferase